MEDRNQQIKELVTVHFFKQPVYITFQYQIYPIFRKTGIKMFNLIYAFIKEWLINLTNNVYMVCLDVFIKNEYLMMVM